ncbi:DNA (cytosine-5)-methyltransferase 1 [Agrobacterium vitis]|nr:DNA (cytosine-5)-methyltransferase 1 [Agrobacterium vitis]
MVLRYASVCSGIEAATQAFHPLGWEPAMFSEIEPFPSAVLAHHYGSNMPGEPLSKNGVPNLGDFTQITDEQIRAIGPIDALIGGTPCQSFSVAGKRLGLDDPRGNLALEYLRLACRLRAKWFLWENVPGVLSSRSDDGSSDFATFLSFVRQCGYGFAYRVLDAQYVRVDGFERAVPQRRRRVFVVGYIGDWRRAAAVLFEPEGMRGDPAPRRKAGQGFTRDFEAGSGSCGFADVAPTLNASFGQKQGLKNQHIDGGCGLFVADVAGTMKACKESGGWSNSIDHAAAGYMVAASMATAIDGTNVARTLSARHYSSPCVDRGQNAVLNGASVRRLMPVECERLQGFPDNYTNVPWRGKNTASDGPRYKAMGNSMAVNVMRWIGSRIDAMEKLSAEGRI